MRTIEIGNFFAPESSNIEWFALDHKGSLAVKFKRGTPYLYHDASYDFCDALLNAYTRTHCQDYDGPSVGKLIAGFVKGREFTQNFQIIQTVVSDDGGLASRVVTFNK